MNFAQIEKHYKISRRRLLNMIDMQYLKEGVHFTMGKQPHSKIRTVIDIPKFEQALYGYRMEKGLINIFGNKSTICSF